jgi:hypothetical protein
MRLKANKTSLYKLVKAYSPGIESVRHTQFSKTPRTRSYFLRWHNKDFECYEAYLTACIGSPLLTVTSQEGRVVHRLSITELQALNMVEN